MSQSASNSKSGIGNKSVYLSLWALKIIWFTGIICMVTVFLFFYNSSVYASYTSSLIVGADNPKESLQSIDELLLSSDEAQLADKKSFVNAALRFQWRNKEPDLNQGNNRTILYNNILKKKLQRAEKKQAMDFSVKPVPN